MKTLLKYICTITLASISAPAFVLAAQLPQGVTYVNLKRSPRQNVLFLGNVILSRSAKLSFLSNVQLTYVASPNDVVCGRITDFQGRIIREGDILARARDIREEIVVNISTQKVKKAKQALKDARLNLERIKKLYKRQVFSERQHEQAENEYIQAASDYDVCRLELLDAKENLDDKALRAPFSGIIEKVYAVAGSSLTEDKSVLLLSVFDPINVRVKLHDVLTDLICVHNEFKVYPTGGTTSYPAWLQTQEIFTDYIELTVKNIKIPKVKLTPEQNKLPKIHTRMRVIDAPEIPEEALWVPANAIRKDKTGAFVWKVDCSMTNQTGKQSISIPKVKKVMVKPKDMFIQKLSARYQAVESDVLKPGRVVLVKTEGKLVNGGRAVMYDSCWMFQPKEKVWVSIPQLAKHIYKVPSEALKKFEDHSFIFVICPDNTVVPVEIFVYNRGDKTAEIIGRNLSPGTKVIVQKSNGMAYPGEKVKLGKKLDY
jgi:multidrug efflux pump subunit AcrA (membrane-fusion protein)